MENFWKLKVSAGFLAICLQLCGKCAFTQNSHKRKLGEILEFGSVKHCSIKGNGTFRTLHKKWSFQWKISSVNRTKSARNYGFGQDNKVILNENFYFSFSGISLLHLLKSNICKDFKAFQRRICWGDLNK